jgi:hypothetical protein
MITIRMEWGSVQVPASQLAVWLFGASGLAQVTIGFPNGTEAVITASSITADRPSECYSITMPGGEPAKLSASWVIPWTRGLAASRGVELLTLLDTGPERHRRMQALMICHRRGWITYEGVTEGNRP